MAIEINSKIPSLSNLVFLVDASNTNSFVSGSTDWNDLGKNSINGTLINGVSYSSSNLGSLVFDGVDDYVDMSTNSLLPSDITKLQFTNTSPFSISVWFKWTSTDVTDEFLFSYKGTQGSYYIAAGQTVAVDRAMYFDYLGPSLVYRGVRTPLSGVSKNVWYHVVCTNGSTNNVSGMKIYLNGVAPINTNRSIGVPSSINYSTGYPTIATREGASNFFNGNISQVAVFNKQLSAAEVTNLYNITRKRYF